MLALKIIRLWWCFELIALPLTFLWSKALNKALECHLTWRDTKADRILWIPAMVGFFERAVIALLIGWEVSGAPAFIGAWVIGKCFGGWGRWDKKSKYDRGLFFVGLLGSAISILIGIILGILIKRLRNGP